MAHSSGIRVRWHYPKANIQVTPESDLFEDLYCSVAASLWQISGAQIVDRYG